MQEMTGGTVFPMKQVSVNLTAAIPREILKCVVLDGITPASN